MSLSISYVWDQMFPPKPTYTDKDVPDLAGKVYIVTGGNSGIGKDLVRVLYAKNAKIYLAARSEEKANQAIEEIKGLSPNSTGELVFLKLDLDDLEGIKASAESFLAKETKLDILFNNAGVMGVLPGPVRTKQGHEVNLGTNVIAPFLFTHFLTPTLISTAKTAPKGSVRVVWTSSFGTETSGVKSLGMSIDDLEKYEKQAGMERYAQSKAGGWLLGVEYARRFKDDGVASFAINPGNLMTNLAREHGWFFQWFLKFIVYEPFNGTCTLLYAGFSQDLGLENSGAWVVPFGRTGTIRQDLVAATKSEAEGGNGHSAKFWETMEGLVKDFI